MSANVLILNADYSLLGIIPWEDAMGMLLMEKVRLVEQYAGRVIRSATATFAFPAVVVRTRYVRARKRVKLNRRNVAARDEYTCTYCGVRPTRSGGAPDMNKLTLDHVMPSSRGGRTSWENLVLCCASCNSTKSNRTPEEAKMPLRRRPRKPGPMALVRMELTNHEIPIEWAPYVDISS